VGTADLHTPEAGKGPRAARLFDQMKATEQPGSGLLRSMSFRDQKDPTRFFTLVIFESEEKARAGSRTHAGRRH